MPLLIKAPYTFFKERSYILTLIFTYFFGLEINICKTNDKCVKITNGDNKTLVIEDCFFGKYNKYWLKKVSLPKQPLFYCDLSYLPFPDKRASNKIPVIYGQKKSNSNFIDFSNNKVTLNIDIFGSSFFMLTRYEEIVKTKRDNHDRFPSTSSISYQENFLNRPIVNEYLEILWYCLKYLWPNLVKKKREFRMIPSHDIDEPFELLFLSLIKVIKKSAGKVITNNNPMQMLKCLHRWYSVKKSLNNDPFDTFSWIMNQSEKANVVSTFNFMFGGTTQFDIPYPLTHPAIKNIILKIKNSPHKLGFHPSYSTATNPETWNKEFSLFKSIYDDNLSDTGGRQHFLRFQAPLTWRLWQDSGLGYDSTLSFADHAGFRCGICFEYPIYDVISRKQLSILERPLIAMDASVIDSRYMGLGYSEKAFDYINQLKSNCKLYNGDFVFLWHNNRLQNNTEKNFYKELLK